MEHLALQGVWLLVGIAAAILAGIFVAQYVKDLVKGVPSALRTALTQTEATALAAMKDAHTKIVADVASAVATATAPSPVPVVVVAVGASGAAGVPGAHANSPLGLPGVV